MGAKSYDLTSSGKLQEPQHTALQSNLEANWLSPAFLASYPPARPQPDLLDQPGAALIRHQLPSFQKDVIQAQQDHQRQHRADTAQLDKYEQLLRWYCHNVKISDYGDQLNYCREKACCFPDHPTTMAGHLAGGTHPDESGALAHSGSGPVVVRKLYTPEQTDQTCLIHYQTPDGTSCTASDTSPCEITCTAKSASPQRTGTLDLRDCLLPHRFTPMPCVSIEKTELTHCTVTPVVPLDRGITLTADDKVTLSWDEKSGLSCTHPSTLPPSPCTTT